MTSDIDPKALALRVAARCEEVAPLIRTMSDLVHGVPIRCTEAEARALAAFLREAVKETKRDDFIRRVAKFFDEDLTAGSFLREDGEGGFVGAIDRMAREIDRLREAVSPWRPIPVTPEIVRYVSRYGGDCRDCADTQLGPICSSGLPCDADKAIEHVLKAINYGFSHGFLKFPPPARIEDAEEPSHDRR